MSMIQIDRESAEKLLRVCLDPCGWKPLWLADVASKLRAALDAPQTPAQTDPKLAALLDSKWRAGVKPDEILGAWAEDFSTYKIIAPPQLRDQLLALQHRAVDALDAPQTQELVGPWTATSVPQQQPDPREAFEKWARTRYGLDDRALELSTDGHYLRSPADVASEAFKAGFAEGRGK